MRAWFAYGRIAGWPDDHPVARRAWDEIVDEGGVEFARDVRLIQTTIDEARHLQAEHDREVKQKLAGMMKESRGHHR